MTNNNNNILQFQGLKTQLDFKIDKDAVVIITNKLLYLSRQGRSKESALYVLKHCNIDEDLESPEYIIEFMAKIRCSVDTNIKGVYNKLTILKMLNSLDNYKDVLYDVIIDMLGMSLRLIQGQDKDFNKMLPKSISNVLSRMDTLPEVSDCDKIKLSHFLKMIHIEFSKDSYNVSDI